MVLSTPAAARRNPAPIQPNISTPPEPWRKAAALQGLRLEPLGPQGKKELMPEEPVVQPSWLSKPSWASRAWGRVKRTTAFVGRKVAAGARRVVAGGAMVVSAIAAVGHWAQIKKWSLAAASAAIHCYGMMPPWLTALLGPMAVGASCIIAVTKLMGKAASAVSDASVKTAGAAAVCVRAVGRGAATAGVHVKSAAVRVARGVGQAAQAVVGGEMGGEVVRLVKNLGRGLQKTAVGAIKTVNTLLEWLGLGVMWVARLPLRLWQAISRRLRPKLQPTTPAKIP